MPRDPSAAATPVQTAPGSPPAAGATRLRLRTQTAFNPGVSVLGEGARQFAETVKAVSGNALGIRLLEAGRVVPTTDLLDAVLSGSIDAGFTWPGYAAARLPPLMLFASVPFGPTPEEYVAWMSDGDGGRIYRELYETLGVRALMCGVTGPEAGGWFRGEVSTVADLKGLKLRYAGLGGEVLARLGATIVPVPSGELFHKLQQGKLDGAEFSMPSIDRAIGFERLSLIYYFPGWHQPGSVVDFYMRLDRWEALEPAQRAQVEISCRANVAWMLGRIPLEQIKALEFFRSAGVSIRAWRPDILEAFRETSRTVLDEQAAKDPAFRAAWDNLAAFLYTSRGWSRLSRP